MLLKHEEQAYKVFFKALQETDLVLMNKPVVLITGALTGIGRATALAFAHEGAQVVVSGRHDDEGQKLATELRNLGTDAEFVRVDVRHEDEVKNLVDKIIARFGRLDIAVNNAGTVGNPGSAADVTPESYQAIFDTNVLGVLLCMKYEIRAMLRQGKGSIVNISSSYGKVGGPTAAMYVGSKHAVEGITKSAAIELAGTGVRVNIVGPGPTETRMFNHFAQTQQNKANFLETHIPTKRMGTPGRNCQCHRVHWLRQGFLHRRCIPGGRRRNDRGLILGLHNRNGDLL